MRKKTITKTLLMLGAASLSSTAFAGLSGTIDNTDWSIGGFVELETTVTDTAVDDNVFDMTARRTRFDFRTATDTEDGKILGRLEFDFAGKTKDKDLVPRIRHAYMQWNGWTFGQATSSFSNFEAYHKSVDDAMPAPIVGLTSNQLERNPQITYGQSFSSGYSFKLGVEKLDNPLSHESSSDPQFVGHLEYDNKGPFAWSISAASYTDTAGENQWKGLLGARYTIGKLSLRFANAHDDGIDGVTTSGSVRYNFDKNNWTSIIYEKGDIAGVEKDRGYINYYHQLTKTVQVGFEYAERGINADNANNKIYRMDIKKLF